MYWKTRAEKKKKRLEGRVKGEEKKMKEHYT